LNALDSVWAFDVRGADINARRFIALGRDIASEQDVTFSEAGTPGFQNDGDNEPTGLHISDGSTSIQSLQGKPENPVQSRWFFTQQHGLNAVYQIIRTGN
jgi:hypothetical protein